MSNPLLELFETVTNGCNTPVAGNAVPLAWVHARTLSPSPKFTYTRGSPTGKQMTLLTTPPTIAHRHVFTEDDEG